MVAGQNFTLSLNELVAPSSTQLICDSSDAVWSIISPGATSGVTQNYFKQKTLAWNQGKGNNTRIRVDHNLGFNAVMFDGSVVYYQYPDVPKELSQAWLSNH